MSMCMCGCLSVCLSVYLSVRFTSCCMSHSSPPHHGHTNNGHFVGRYPTCAVHEHVYSHLICCLVALANLTFVSSDSCKADKMRMASHNSLLKWRIDARGPSHNGCSVNRVPPAGFDLCLVRFWGLCFALQRHQALLCFLNLFRFACFGGGGNNSERFQLSEKNWRMTSVVCIESDA